jgi:hypothetical protein
MALREQAPSHIDWVFNAGVGGERTIRGRELARDEAGTHAAEMMRVRKRTVEHPFGTLKQWMGATHFLTRKLNGVSAEMSLNVRAYNLKRVDENHRHRRLIEGDGGVKARFLLPQRAPKRFIRALKRYRR